MMEELQLDHTVHFATTLFNVATAYRTAGKYEEALANYRRALEIYQKELPKDDYRLAELYSSISILLEKLNENENAALFLEKAIQIMEKQPGTRVEVATSRTSLALIELKMDKLEAAEKHLELAISAFKEDGGKTDTHYSAALAGLGEVCYRQGSLERALENYEHALFEVEKHFGRKKATVCSAAIARRSAESLDRAQKLKSMRCSAKILPGSLTGRGNKT
ncbi:MAG: tetratricopeptide repeat protein [Gallintestinimicrobium sp.]